ncbi:hypothetical protein SpCBS45565_g05846 [Spizellomyces sp. 'palustris']|nr:hypothetical protein SpCBS45565_g05846 [Spizellomyces sp. 'palustris']
MPNIIARFQARLALGSHPSNVPPIILHSRPSLDTKKPSADIFHDNDLRRIRWALRLKDLDWYECSELDGGAVHRVVGTRLGKIPVPIIQIGKDMYWGTGSVMRALERRFPYPTLYSGPVALAGSQAHTRHHEGLSAALTSWCDKVFRPALVPLLTNPRDPVAQAHPVHFYLQTVESMLTASTPVCTNDFTSNRSFIVDQSESPESTQWHGIHRSTTHPHMTDLMLGSTALLARSVPSLRSTWTETYPLTASWLDRLLDYLEKRTETGVAISSEDAVEVLARKFTVGECGTIPPQSEIVEVELQNGATINGQVVTSSKWDLTLGRTENVVGEEGQVESIYSITLPKDEIGTYTILETLKGSGDKKITYID